MIRRSLLCLAMLLTTPAAWGQASMGKTELSLFSGGGPAIVGGLSDRGFWLAGARWGRQITPDIGSSLLRGHLQYAVEFIPLYLQLQSKTVYGAGLTPFLMRYHFTSGQRIVPFVEVGAGLLITRDDVPEGTSRFNFTPQGGIGIQVLPAAKRFGVTMGIRYHHTSNAGLSHPNPGINAIMLHAGISWWK